MAALSYIRYPVTRSARYFTAVFALLLFGFVSVATISGFLVYQILHPARTSPSFDLSVMLGRPMSFSFALPGGGTRDGWLYPGLRGAPAIVVCHGYESQRADVLTLVTALQEHEYNVFLFDFTGHGSSPGVTTLGYHESAELESAVEALSARDDVDAHRFGLWGVDMGGYAALRVATQDPRIAALAVDDAYGDPRDMVQVQIKNSGLTVIPFVTNVSDWGFRLVNYPYRHDLPVSRNFAKLAGVPKLFVESDDRPGLASLTESLFVQAPAPKQAVRDSVSYSQMSDDDRKMYENRIVSFFLSSIPPGSSRRGD